MTEPTTELWFRDPAAYMKECAKLLVPRIIWDECVLVNRAIDPQAQIELHYPQSFEYRLIVVHDDCAVELRRGYTTDSPYAVYPVWNHDSHDMDDLDEMLVNPSGEDMMICRDTKIPVQKRPVYGQEHRIIVTRWPDFSTHGGRAFVKTIAQAQREHPEVKLHLWGSNSFRALFGMGLSAVDVDPSKEAQFKLIHLANGKKVPLSDINNHGQWVRMLGMSVTDLSELSNRLILNMKSAIWASQYYNTNLKFKSVGSDPVDPNTHHHLPPQTPSHLTEMLKAKDGDKVTCNNCSLMWKCKYARFGAVCSIPDTDGAKLAAYFNTRDSDVIIDGLGKVLATQAQRFERAVEAEEFSDDGELNNDVTRLGHVIAQDGERLAKLVDPRLAAAGATRLTAFIGGNHVHANGTTNSLVADIVRELEQRGIARDDITDEMVEQYIRGQHAIEAKAT